MASWTFTPSYGLPSLVVWKWMECRADIPIGGFEVLWSHCRPSAFTQSPACTSSVMSSFNVLRELAYEISIYH